MTFQPTFTITPTLLGRVEAIASLRERVFNAAVQVSWIPSLRKDSRIRNAHSSTAIEGNRLSLEQVQAIESGAVLDITARSEREILNYFAALKHIENIAGSGTIKHEDLFELHRIMAEGVMDQGTAGRYRTIFVRVGFYNPPPPDQVSGLMFELLEWWNKESTSLSPVLSSAILHYQFEAIHPFADGNGRTGRALALWELFRRGFDSHHIFSVDEFYWEDRLRYFEQLTEVQARHGDLTTWLEYCAEGLLETLERVWRRMQKLSASAGEHPLVLRPRQEQLLDLLRLRGPMAPREIRESLSVSKQGAVDILNPLVKAGLVERVGNHKTGKYVLK
jgi:Fic family protein